MKELPSPTFPLSPLSLPGGLIRQSVAPFQQFSQTPVRQIEGGGLMVSWAKHNCCEHLLVRDELTLEVVGTYRLLTPAQARRVGSTYSDLEFDLTRLRERMVELGRSCVHPDYRQGGVIMALWGALAEFMVRNKLDTMIGCASIPMLHNGIVSGDVAASIWHQLKATHLAPIEYQVHPRLRLPVDQLDHSLTVEPPALIKGYLRLGAKILGAPAWDPDFNTADLPMLMRISDLPPRYRKHFLGAVIAGFVQRSARSSSGRLALGC